MLGRDLDVGSLHAVVPGYLHVVGKAAKASHQQRLAGIKRASGNANMGNLWQWENSYPGSAYLIVREDK
jgi:hypothetical protein